MKTNEEKVDKVNVHGCELVKNPRSPRKIQADLDDFNARWGSAFKKISEYISVLQC